MPFSFPLLLLVYHFFVSPKKLTQNLFHLPIILIYLCLSMYDTAYLMMDFNKLVGTIPPELGKLTQLTGWLSLEGNSLTGTIPESFVGFTNATWIYLNQNKLSGSAEFLCDALNPVEKYGYADVNSTSPLMELWVDREEVNCTCCNCCPFLEN